MAVIAFLWSWQRKKTADAATPVGRLPRLAMAIGVALAMCVGIEGALGLLGVPKGEPVFAIKNRDGDLFRADGSMVHDSDVLWRLVPGHEFNGLTVNEQGFLARPFSPKKAPGVKRLVVMGDSCSAQGQPPYSDLLHDQLVAAPLQSQTWEVVNTAVHGYTVSQGYALFVSRVFSFAPDAVSLYFGWNDHWLTDQPDHTRMSHRQPALVREVLHGLSKKRLASLVRTSTALEPGQRVVRVSPERYRHDLTRLVAKVKEIGALPLVLTAPRAATLSTALIHNKNANRVEEAVRLHDEYMAITREVARDTGAAMIDLEALIPDGLRSSLFTRDGIHLTQAGHGWIAGQLYQFLSATKTNPITRQVAIDR
jgi:lysophospholipase L1-like esterase